MSSLSTCSERRGRALRRGLLLLTAIAAVPTYAQIEKLVMPGPLVEAHADLEDDCTSCHTPFARSEQRNLCLGCHEDAGRDIEAREGYHGRSRARSGECSLCHGDHLGRDGDIVALRPETFDHDQTDMPLRGQHRAAECGACHRDGVRHREADKSCADCHGEDDVHEGSLGRNCGECHEPGGWRESVEFDHGRTDFPLTGRHADARCAACHPGGASTGEHAAAPTDCHSCHGLDDTHGGRFGRACGTCHEATEWKRVRFRHARDTRFALTGRHARIACAACHRRNAYEVTLQSECVACHRADDGHKGRLGTDCDGCHGPDAWSADSFDHDQTGFSLAGHHAKVDCLACHTGAIAEGPLETTCFACHGGADVHAGQLGTTCEKCHAPTGWRRDLHFDHGLTRFPLLGLHAAVACEECHLSARFGDARLPCVNCHQSRDHHDLSLGPDCAACHNPNGWAFWRFEHDRDTDFRLDGAHAGKSCRACHRLAAPHGVAQSRRCDACHDHEDRHAGQYGPECGRCHSATDWRDLRGMR